MPLEARPVRLEATEAVCRTSTRRLHTDLVAASTLAPGRLVGA